MNPRPRIAAQMAQVYPAGPVQVADSSITATRGKGRRRVIPWASASIHASIPTGISAISQWSSRNTTTGETWEGQPYDYVRFTGRSPKHNEDMTPIDSRELWEKHRR